MREQPLPAQRRGLTAIDGAMTLIIVLLIIQIWLITVTLENYLAGHHETTLPAAIVSGAILVGCAGLYAFIDRVDSKARE